MQKIICLLMMSVILSACGHTYYIVRHAEKAVPSEGTVMNTPDDPPLSGAGTRRAETLKERLKSKGIRFIFSTDTKRTLATAEPLSTLTGLTIQTYGPKPDSIFLNHLKQLQRNTLIVGHSNTVDEIVNGLTKGNKLTDLADVEYDNLFIVRYRRFFGKKIRYERTKY